MKYKAASSQVIANMLKGLAFESAPGGLRDDGFRLEEAAGARSRAVFKTSNCGQGAYV
jgi:hypothetical protein